MLFDKLKDFLRRYDGDCPRIFMFSVATIPRFYDSAVDYFFECYMVYHNAFSLLLLPLLVKMTIADGKGAELLCPPNFKRPRRNSIFPYGIT